ncbi:MAG: D-alanyl-D-alanine carboxypeptidase/D-alanyl-D-alanine-endopeptidase [Azoarcus sp.]|jgi:D-alanyl-D-alanine carboxypeptidase/D-alanyl-D-alanine-endopeptidase (penicillin-binding protein 4)|nr:D-alanyl-D-alanine carboxypeptidase/D-alanyl-D-alanine-endopeptidase [Azoarcus sp.]MDD2872319.1 D-alanyl-D-alanine carboxypeptidase/D-alanyl-D-alanine-endopeptidase [Azoarcus sp.]MDX9837673.1 D-alanyl-D-alanine carboxypeptidase/D-alanyl-D-alanine-endopeptidase [Azoarcus sp.]
MSLTSNPISHRFVILGAFFVGLLVAGFAHAAGAEALPASVRQALDQARVPVDAVGIWVQPVDAATPTLAINADQPMNPASVMKLVTAFTSLEYFGPSHTWQTRISSTGPVHNGVLQGNLYIVGGGDPVLAYERVWKLFRRLRALGVDTITGDIVLDGSVLRLPSHDPDAFDGRGLRPYNSGPYGLLLHFNTLQLALFPGTGPNDTVTVASEPPLSGIVIDNRLQTSGASCGVWYRDLEARLEPGPRLVLSGSLPASCGPRNWSAAPLPPEDFSVAMIAGLWKEVGGQLQGQVRSGPAPGEARTQLLDDSPALAEIVRDMNKWSSNVIARQLLANLGSSNADGAPDMVAAGAQVATAQLAAAGVQTSGLVIENGAGLSRIERVRADTLGQLLIAAWQRPWMAEFIAALPIAGEDGTARKRLIGSPARGQAHIKTGTINGVRAIAGYVLDHDGRRHVVVMLVNHAEAAGSRAAQDALLEWVWAGGR